MTAIRHVCLLGLGEVGAVVADALAAKKDLQLTAFDITFDAPDSRASTNASKRPGVQAAASARAAVERADLVISAVTAGQSLSAAQSVAGHIKPNCWFLDLNSVSPNTKRATAERINAAGGRYVEAAIMAPIHPRRMAAPILLGGRFAAEFAPLAAGIGFSNCAVHSAQEGGAAATKMCRSVVIKGLESLIMESLLTARHYGVEGEVLASLQNLMPGVDWNAHGYYMMSRSIEHGTRRAEEMREVCRTVTEAGLQARMSAACVESQQWAAGHDHALTMADAGRERGEDPLAVALDIILSSVKKPEH